MKKFVFIFLLFLSLRNSATHIVGGEIIYDYLGNNAYKITLKIYRDCSSTTGFDGVPGINGQVIPAIVSIMDLNGLPVDTLDMGAPIITKIPPTINNPCIQTPNHVCVEEGVYTKTVTLQPKAGGYFVVYQRCCRNTTVLNLLLSGTQGSTYYTKIPGPELAVNNSSPRFKNFPPIFLCNNLAFNFNHAATDPDGDLLVYSICPPFIGLDGCCPYMTVPPPLAASPNCSNPPPFCPGFSLPPPYQPVNFVSPYNGSYPISSNPSITINPNTGVMSGSPNLIGQFVVGVCVQEFRNNVLINTHFRDFQFNIVSCVVNVVSSVADALNQCVGQTLTFTNTSTSNIGALTYLWDFGENKLTNDTSNVINPTHTYQDTGIYTITLISNPRKPCSDTLRKIFYVYPPLSVDIIRPSTQCFKNNAFAFKITGVYSPQTTFKWLFPQEANISISNFESPSGVRFNKPGVFVVKLQAKQFACRDSSIDSVKIIGPPIAKIGSLAALLCDPASIAFANTSISELPANYRWKFSNGNTSTDFEPKQVFSPSGIYTVSLTAITRSICVDSSQVSLENIKVLPSPKSNFSLNPEVTSIFEPEISVVDKSSADAISWHYSFGDGTSSEFPIERHRYSNDGNYLVVQTVRNQSGCVDSTGKIVQILPEFRFWIPNSFTPDENNLNDQFRPMLYGVANYNFRIYDRWGEKVFESNDTNAGWNGYFNGELCKQDIYAWRISFKNETTSKIEVYVGHVLILKNL